MVGFFYHEIFLQHLEGFPHVERPERLTAIMEKLTASPVKKKLNFVRAKSAELDWIMRVHDPSYVESILSIKTDEAVMLDWGDTVATSATPEAARYAAGAGVQAVRMVHEGKLGSAFCAVRPPGHHAEPDRAMGFCIFNNIAIAAADLLETGLRRVAIIDWDVHHGNGTEKIFIADNRVLYVSMHQYPHYPGTGHADVTGHGKGEGFTLNIPMGAGAGDIEYLNAFNQRIITALDKFQPEFILISAGFDGHRDDPLASMVLSSEAYGQMTRIVKDVAARHCQGKIVSILEGGYDLKALAESVESPILD